MALLVYSPHSDFLVGSGSEGIRVNRSDRKGLSLKRKNCQIGKCKLEKFGVGHMPDISNYESKLLDRFGKCGDKVSNLGMKVRLLTRKMTRLFLTFLVLL